VIFSGGEVPPVGSGMVFWLAAEVNCVKSILQMKMHSPIAQPRRTPRTAYLAIVLSLVIPLGDALASNPQPEPPKNPLVYTARTTSTTRGFFNDAYNSTGLLLIGPAGPGAASGFDYATEQQTEVEVNVSPVRSYTLDSSGGAKFYYFYDSSQILGFINTARQGLSNRPSIFLASLQQPSEGDLYSQGSVSASDSIGKAVLRAPFAGAAKIWIPPTVKSSYSYYDLNPEYMLSSGSEEDFSGEFNFLGQTRNGSGPAPAVLVSYKTTYKFSPSLTKLVYGMSFENAAMAIEEKLEADGYVAPEPLPESSE
jgi:hypothetical protein